MIEYGQVVLQLDLKEIPTFTRDRLLKLQEFAADPINIKISAACARINKGDISDALVALDELRQYLAYLDKQVVDCYATLANYQATQAHKALLPLAEEEEIDITNDQSDDNIEE